MGVKSNIVICCMSTGVMITSSILPMSALANSLHGQFIIAKPPDEREPEVVQQAIEQIPTSQAPVARTSTPRVESPIPPTKTSSGSTNTNSTSQPSNSGATSTPSTPVNTNSTSQPSGRRYTPRESAPANNNSTSQPSGRRYTPRESAPANNNSTSQPSRGNYTPRESTPVNSTPQPSGRRSLPPRQGGHKPITDDSTLSRSKQPVYRQINFVDIAFGVLAPGDFQSQGRYFHFYQFEGRENQLIQIRLSGSADQRSSNNLSLNPLMFLLDPDKRVLVTRSSSGTANGVRDAFVFVRLPVKGTYTIAVTSKNPREKGRYSLALRDDRASYTLDETEDLSDNSQILRKNHSPYKLAKFFGKKDQLISIRVDSVFEEFSPYIVLLDSQGKIIASDNEKDGKYSALIDRARLPEDGTYYVAVISAIPREHGTYRLTIF